MSKFGFFVVGVVVGGCAVFGSLKYHIVRTTDGLKAIPKLSATFEDTYVDVRQFGISDWSRHQSLVAAITAAGQQSIFEDSADAVISEGVSKFLDAVRNLGGDS